jgi:two-component sensor histidine kinase/CHASE3 domain sensor protein
MRTRKHKTNLSIMVLLASIFSFLFLTYILSVLATHSLNLVLQTHEIRDSTESVLATMLSAETGQRGFVITAKPVFLEPYEAAIIKVPLEIDALSNLLFNNNEQLSRLNQIRQLWDAKRLEMKKTIDYIKIGNVEAAVETVSDESVKRTMDEIRTKIIEMQLEENRLLHITLNNLRQQRWWASALLLTGIGALLLLAFQEIRHFNARNAGLLTANTRLDKLVQERTREVEHEKSQIIALLQDVTHRVGNNLAMVSALLSLQSRRSQNDEVKTALEDAKTRVAAIAAGQRRLQLDLDADEVHAKPYLENLLSETVQTAKERGISFTYDIADIPLPGKDAVSYIVLTNELSTNALKHAFPNGMKGEIKVHLGIRKENKGSIIELQVEDDGIGANEDVVKTGLGHTIVQSLLKSMDATLETKIIWPDRLRKGYISLIRIPISENAS